MKVTLVPGQSYDLVSGQEMAGHMNNIQQKMQEYVNAASVGVKPFRIVSNVKQVTASPFAVVSTGPNSGYIWAVLRVTFVGDAAAASPVLFRANDPSTITMTAAGISDLSSARYQIDALTTGNAKSYAKGALLLQNGEFLIVGVFDATAVGHNYRIVAEGIEVPAEMISKLLL